MATNTTNLGLVKPELNDDIDKTIQNLASNFQKLDDVSDIFISDIPITGSYLKNQRLWNNDASVGEYIGWINIRQGMAAPFQKRLTYYNVGDKVKDSTDNSHYYIAQTAGTTGVVEPDFPLTANATVKDVKFATLWTRNQYYNVNDMILPNSDNGYWYLCQTAGNANNEFEPNWPTVEGQTITDGNVLWIAHRIITWKESGTSANFRPFGKIE